LIKKTPRAGGAGGISSESSVMTIFVKDNEAECFPADYENESDLCMKMTGCCDNGCSVVIGPCCLKDRRGGRCDCYPANPGQIETSEDSSEGLGDIAMVELIGGLAYLFFAE